MFSMPVPRIVVMGIASGNLVTSDVGADLKGDMFDGQELMITL